MGTTIVLVCFDPFCPPSASACRSLKASPATKPPKGDKPRGSTSKAKSKAKSKSKPKGGKKPAKKGTDDEDED